MSMQHNVQAQPTPIDDLSNIFARTRLRQLAVLDLEVQVDCIGTPVQCTIDDLSVIVSLDGLPMLVGKYVRANCGMES